MLCRCNALKFPPELITENTSSIKQSGLLLKRRLCMPEGHRSFPEVSQPRLESLETFLPAHENHHLAVPSTVVPRLKIIQNQ